MPTSLINIQYCYDYLVDQISLGLLLYSHVPTAIIALVFGIFIYVKTRRPSSAALLGLCVSFAAWCALSITSWFAFLGSEFMMFTWGVTDIFGFLMFFFSYYFLYSFIKGRDLPAWQKLFGIILIAPTLFITVTSTNLEVYDSFTCEAWESEAVTSYNSFVQTGMLLLIMAFIYVEYRRAKTKNERAEVALAGTGVSLFLFIFFFFTSFLTNLLVRLGWEYAYNLELFGLFGMPVFLIYLGFLIVRHRAFDLRVFSAQAIVILLVTLFVAQFAFVYETAAIILNVINLVLVLWLGLYLVRNVRKEIRLRFEIENQKQELASANERLKDLDQLKSEFVSLATHQVRSPLTAIKGYASLILDGDYGKISPQLHDVVRVIYDACENLVVIVGEFLDISRIELGRMKYERERFDLKLLLEQTIEQLMPNVEQAGLTLEFRPDELEEGETYEVMADKVKIKQVISNLIDNSVKYTPEGGLTITLSRNSAVIRIEIKDTGVGIDSAELLKLFEKFARAKDASKINVNGTGLGLYIAKQMIEANDGRLWAESEGAGKGSTFFIELKPID